MVSRIKVIGYDKYKWIINLSGKEFDETKDMDSEIQITRVLSLRTLMGREIYNIINDMAEVLLSESVLSMEKEIKSEKHTLMQRLKFI